MRFDAFIEVVGDLRYFDMKLLRTLFPEDEHSLPVIVHRWKRSGRLVELRRGLYVLGEQYRRVAVHAAALAEVLYYPSYLSLEWALSWYGIIPEMGVAFTSVTPRERTCFENAFGVFRYRTVKQSFFCGYRCDKVMGAELRVAEPEKALVDFWYLSVGEWSPQRMESMRFDPKAIPDTVRLAQFAALTDAPRLRLALAAWHDYAGSQAEEELITNDD